MADKRKLALRFILIDHIVKMPFVRLRQLARMYGLESTRKHNDLVVMVIREMLAQ